jgi:hypothetical protein
MEIDEDGDIIPGTGSARSIGEAGATFATVYVDVAVIGGSVTGDLHPSTDDTYYFGEKTTPLRWKGGTFGSDGVTIDADDTGLYLGATQESVLYHKNFALNANTALTGVLEGTPVTPATANQSLFISNIYNDGDILIAVSDGGNSIAAFYVDASIPYASIYGMPLRVQNGDTDDYLLLTVVSDIPTIYGTGAYVRIGDAGTRTYMSASEDNLLISGMAEIIGSTYFINTSTHFSSLIMRDDISILLGASYDGIFGYQKDDADACCIHFGLPHVDEDANNVAVLALLDRDAAGTDVGASGLDFSGITEPTLAIGNEATDAWSSLDAGDVNGAGKGLYFKPAADEDVNALQIAVTENPIIFWDESETALAIDFTGGSAQPVLAFHDLDNDSVGKIGHYEDDRFAIMTGNGMLIWDAGSSTTRVKNNDDSAYGNIVLGALSFATLSAYSSAGALNAANGDNLWVTMNARDNGVGLVEVARLQGAADAYFSTGGSQECKFYNSGAVDWTGAGQIDFPADNTFNLNGMICTQYTLSLIRNIYGRQYTGGGSLDLDIQVTGGSSVHHIDLNIDGNEIFRVQATGDGAGGVTALHALFSEDAWIADEKFICTAAVDDDYFGFKAVDNDGAEGALLEVARVVSANDPYWSMGGSQEFKFTNAGLCGFFSATPVAQQTYPGAALNSAYGVGDLDTEAEIIAAINATNTMVNLLRGMAINLGLTAAS